MISLGLPPRLQWLPQEELRSRGMPKFSEWPQGTAIRDLIHAGILCCRHLSQDAGSHVTACEFHQVMNPLRGDGPGRVRSPSGGMHRLDAVLLQPIYHSRWMVTLSSRGAPDALDSFWWNVAKGADKVSMFKLPGGKLMAAERRVALSADFTVNNIHGACCETLLRTNKFLYCTLLLCYQIGPK